MSNRRSFDVPPSANSAASFFGGPVSTSSSSVGGASDFNRTQPTHAPGSATLPTAASRTLHNAPMRSVGASAPLRGVVPVSYNRVAAVSSSAATTSSSKQSVSAFFSGTPSTTTTSAPVHGAFGGKIHTSAANFFGGAQAATLGIVASQNEKMPMNAGSNTPSLQTKMQPSASSEVFNSGNSTERIQTNQTSSATQMSKSAPTFPADQNDVSSFAMDTRTLSEAQEEQHAMAIACDESHIQKSNPETGATTNYKSVPAIDSETNINSSSNSTSFAPPNRLSYKLPSLPLPPPTPPPGSLKPLLLQATIACEAEKGSKTAMSPFFRVPPPLDLSKITTAPASGNSGRRKLSFSKFSVPSASSNNYGVDRPPNDLLMTPTGGYSGIKVGYNPTSMFSTLGTLRSGKVGDSPTHSVNSNITTSSTPVTNMSVASGRGGASLTPVFGVSTAPTVSAADSFLVSTTIEVSSSIATPASAPLIAPSTELPNNLINVAEHATSSRLTSPVSENLPVEMAAQLDLNPEADIPPTGYDLHQFSEANNRLMITEAAVATANDSAEHPLPQVPRDWREVYMPSQEKNGGESFAGMDTINFAATPPLQEPQTINLAVENPIPENINSHNMMDSEPELDHPIQRRDARVTHNTELLPSPLLPDGWIEVVNPETEQVYYSNIELNISQWDHPGTAVAEVVSSIQEQLWSMSENRMQAESYEAVLNRETYDYVSDTIRSSGNPTADALLPEYDSHSVSREEKSPHFEKEPMFFKNDKVAQLKKLNLALTEKVPRVKDETISNATKNVVVTRNAQDAFIREDYVCGSNGDEMEEVSQAQKVANVGNKIEYEKAAPVEDTARNTIKDALPVGWLEITHPDTQQVYYYNETLSISQWEYPGKAEVAENGINKDIINEMVIDSYQEDVTQREAGDATNTFLMADEVDATNTFSDFNEVSDNGIKVANDERCSVDSTSEYRCASAKSNIEDAFNSYQERGQSKPVLLSTSAEEVPVEKFERKIGSDGWEVSVEKELEHEKSAFVDETTTISLPLPNGALPVGWLEIIHPDTQQVYYYNENLNISQWEHPGRADLQNDSPDENEISGLVAESNQGGGIHQKAVSIITSVEETMPIANIVSDFNEVACKDIREENEACTVNSATAASKSYQNNVFDSYQESEQSKPVLLSTPAEEVPVEKFERKIGSDGWEVSVEKELEHEKSAFVDETTTISLPLPNGALPVGWLEIIHPDTQQVYYYNESLNISQWEHPGRADLQNDSPDENEISGLVAESNQGGAIHQKAVSKITSVEETMPIADEVDTSNMVSDLIEVSGNDIREENEACTVNSATAASKSYQNDAFNSSQESGQSKTVLLTTSAEEVPVEKFERKIGSNGWEASVEKEIEHDRVAFVDETTTISMSLPNGALPVGWLEIIHPDTQQVYYYNESLNISQWEHPGRVELRKDSPEENEISGLVAESNQGGAIHQKAVSIITSVEETMPIANIVSDFNEVACNDIREENEACTVNSATAASKSYQNNVFDSYQESEQSKPVLLSTPAEEVPVEKFKRKIGSDGWEVSVEKELEHEKSAFVDETTTISLPLPNGALPVGWLEIVHPDTQQVYYYNESLNISQWEHPGRADLQNDSPDENEISGLVAESNQGGGIHQKAVSIITSVEETMPIADEVDTSNMVSDLIEVSGNDIREENEACTVNSATAASKSYQNDAFNSYQESEQSLNKVPLTSMEEVLSANSEIDVGVEAIHVAYFDKKTEIEKTAFVDDTTSSTGALLNDALPVGWLEIIHPDTQQVYYYNESLNISQWDRPSVTETNRDNMNSGKDSVVAASDQDSSQNLGSNSGTEAQNEVKVSYIQISNRKASTMVDGSAHLNAGGDGTDRGFDEVEQNASSLADNDLPDGWVTLPHRETNQIYYYNQEQNLTQWEKPFHSKVKRASDVDDTSSDSVRILTGDGQNSEPGNSTAPSTTESRQTFVDWIELKDSTTQKMYYYCETTGETSWDPPIRKGRDIHHVSIAESSKTSSTAERSFQTLQKSDKELQQHNTYINKLSTSTKSQVSSRVSGMRPSHALVSFGFGGRICLMRPEPAKRLAVAPALLVQDKDQNSATISWRKGPIEVRRLYHLMDPSVVSLPSPSGNQFFGPWNSSSDAAAWEYLRFRCDSEHGDSGMLWKLILVAALSKGQLRSNEGFKNTAGPEAKIVDLLVGIEESIQEVSIFPLMREHSSSPSSESLSKIQSLLLHGERSGAVEEALTGKHYALALLIASMCDKITFQSAARRFTEDVIAPGSPLHTLTALFSGVLELGKPHDDSRLTPREFWGNAERTNLISSWRHHLATIMSNRTTGWERLVKALGDRLLMNREIAASHFCYMVSGCQVSLPSPKSRLSLVGCDCSLPGNTWLMTHEAVQGYERTEAFEWAKRRGNPNAAIPALQPFKLKYAMLLADFGWEGRAKMYLDSIRLCTGLNANNKTDDVYSADFIEALNTFEDRIVESSKTELPKLTSGSSWSTADIVSSKIKSVSSVLTKPRKVIEPKNQPSKEKPIPKGAGQEVKKENSVNLTVSNAISSGAADSLSKRNSPASTTDQPTEEQPLIHHLRTVYPEQEVKNKKLLVENELCAPSAEGENAATHLVYQSFESNGAEESTQPSKFACVANNIFDQKHTEIMNEGSAKSENLDWDLSDAHNKKKEQKKGTTTKPIPNAPRSSGAAVSTLTKGMHPPVKPSPKSEGSMAENKQGTPSDKGKSSWGGFGLRTWVAKKLNSEATEADLGGKLEAYYDKKLGRWIFPDDDPNEVSKPLAPPPVVKASVAKDDAKQAVETASKSDPLAALMAPPPSRGLPANRAASANSTKAALKARQVAPSSPAVEPPKFAIFQPPNQ